MPSTGIFITGASGFIGKAVVKTLCQENYTLTALLLPDEEAKLPESVHIVYGDLTDTQSLSGKLKNHQTVIHIAGAVGFQSWKNCISINIGGTRNILEEMLKSGIRRFIYMSSVSVYGRVPDVHITEDFPYKKIGDPYGDTKIEAEKLIKEYTQKGTVDFTIIRPTAVYGEGDNKFLPKLIENLESGKFKMMGDGSHTVDLVNVADVAEFVSVVLKNPESIGQTYNLANKENPTWNEFLKVVAEELGIPPTNKYIPYKLAYAAATLMELISKITGKPPRLSRYAVRLVGRQYFYVIDKAEKELGFTPSIDLFDGIRKCIRETLKDS